MAYSGGCQCGAIRFEVSADPVVAYCCHCTDCQQQSSSAFGMSVWFPASAFKLTKGELVEWRVTADSGTEKLCTFCGTCGSRISHAFSDGADMLSVKGGALDDISRLTPAGHIWVRSAQPWMKALIGDQLCYDKEPESFDALIERF